MATAPGPLPPPSTPWVDSPGTPSLSFRQYFLTLDAAVRALVKLWNGAFSASGTLIGQTALVVAVDDFAAAAAGVPVGGFYRTPVTGSAPHTISVIQVRVN